MAIIAQSVYIWNVDDGRMWWGRTQESFDAEELFSKERCFCPSEESGGGESVEQVGMINRGRIHQLCVRKEKYGRGKRDGSCGPILPTRVQQ